jgi:hypothetical protein
MGELVVGIQGGDKGANVLVTELGELVTAPLSNSTPYYVSVAIASTPYLVVPAIAGKCFLITGLLIASDKNFGTATTAETVVLYEANAADLSTNIKTITQVDLLKNDRLVATGLNLVASNARALVASGTDSAVDVTVAGYYINA